MTLAETQAAFFALTFDSATAPPAAPALSGPSAAAPAARLALYRDANVRRLVSSLRLSFPNTTTLLGDDAFAAAAHTYVAAPCDGVQRHERLMRGFPAFLRDAPGNPIRPDAGALAELEWTRNEAARAAAAPTIARADLAALGPSALGITRLHFAPAVRLVHLEADVFALWAALAAGATPPPPQLTPTPFVVWRAGRRVFHAALEPAEALALARAMAGAPLDAVCDAFRRRLRPADEACAVLTSWIEDGLVAARVTL